MSRPSLVGNDLLSLHVTEGNPEQPRTCHARRTRDLMTCCMCVSSVLVITRLELLQISFEAIIKSGIKTKQLRLSAAVEVASLAVCASLRVYHQWHVIVSQVC